MEQLKRLRAEKGLSQARLAARAGLDPSTVNQIERGARDPSPATLHKLADALEVGLVELLEDEAPKAQAPLPFEYGEDQQRGYVAVSDLLEDWRYLIERTTERHLQNVSSNLFETAEGAAAYS